MVSVLFQIVKIISNGCVRKKRRVFKRDKLTIYNIDFYEESNFTEQSSKQLDNNQIYKVVSSLLEYSNREFQQLDSPFFKPRSPCVYVLPVEYPFQRYFWNFNIPPIWYKVGFTNNIKRRIKQYNTIRIHPYTDYDVFKIFTPYAEFVENLTHKYLKLINYKNTFSYEGNEIFPAPFNLVIRIVNAFNDLLILLCYPRKNA